METLLYDDFRKSIFKFWVSYINTICVPLKLDLKITSPLTKQAQSFLILIIELHLNTPWYRALELSAGMIQTEQLCFSIKKNNIKQLLSNQTTKSIFSKRSLQFLEENHESFHKVADVLTPIEDLLYVKDKTVIGVIGFYIYDVKKQVYWVFLYNLNNDTEYDHEEKMKYHTNPNLGAFRTEYAKIPFGQARISLNSFANSINMFPNVFANKLKEYGNCTLNEYHWYNRMLEALHFYFFDPSYKNKTEVAHAVGFNSLNAYSKAFKRFYLISHKDIVSYK